MPKKRGLKWTADVTLKGQRVRVGGFGTKPEAEQAEIEIRAKLLRGEAIEGYDTPETRTLGTLRDLAIEKFWAGTKGERTSAINADDVVSLLGDVDVKLVTHLAIEAAVVKLKERGCSGATINRKLSALSKMLRLAEDRGWIQKTPRIHRQKESEHRIRYLSPTEETAVLEWFWKTGNLGMHSLVEFLIDTGVRLSEALEARWDDFEGGWLALYHTKNGGHRRVPMTPRAKRALESRPKDSPCPWNLTVSQCDYYWARMREHLGLDRDEQFVIHALRHTFASRLVQRGVELATVSKLLGHRSLLTTMRYAHLAPHNLQAAVEVLDPGSEVYKICNSLHAQSRAQESRAVPG